MEGNMMLKIFSSDKDSRMLVIFGAQSWIHRWFLYSSLLKSYQMRQMVSMFRNLF